MYMKKNKRPLWVVIFILCALIAGAGIGVLVYSRITPTVTRADFTPSQPTQAVDAAQTNATEPTQAPRELSPDQTFGYKITPLGDFDVDFGELKATNKDIYAWIYVPNTNVDYPVVRNITDGDDTYYLHHNIYRRYQFAGTVFSELQNNPDMHDPVTVFYGHNMLDTSMFASLHNFEDADFFDKNTTAYVITEDKVYTYLIYAAYEYDDRHILNSFYMNDDTVFQDYLNTTLEPHSYNANVRANVTLNTDNRILVLSTCTNGASNVRYLVQGVLVDETEK